MFEALLVKSPLLFCFFFPCILLGNLKLLIRHVAPLTDRFLGGGGKTTLQVVSDAKIPRKWPQNRIAWKDKTTRLPNAGQMNHHCIYHWLALDKLDIPEDIRYCLQIKRCCQLADKCKSSNIPLLYPYRPRPIIQRSHARLGFLFFFLFYFSFCCFSSRVSVTIAFRF